MALIDDEFLKSLEQLGRTYPRFKWYITAIVGLAAFNYPEEIPFVYKKLLEEYIPDDQQLKETRKIRESLTKICGIHGAAKTGNAIRALDTVVPEELRDERCYRKHDTPERASARGKAFYQRIYGPNASFDEDKTSKASPDYYYIATSLFYSYIFSFDEILGDLETGQVIVSCLIGIDCQDQATNHMKGMLYNGATKDEICMLRDITLRIAERLSFSFKTKPAEVPDI